MKRSINIIALLTTLWCSGLYAQPVPELKRDPACSLASLNKKEKLLYGTIAIGSLVLIPFWLVIIRQGELGCSELLMLSPQFIANSLAFVGSVYALTKLGNIDEHNARTQGLIHTKSTKKLS